MTLEYGYLEDLDAVLSKMREDLQMLVFSATIPEHLLPTNFKDTDRKSVV